MKTLLYVEDEPNDVLLATLACKQVGFQPQVQLSVARDGREAIEYLTGSGRFSDRATHPLPALVLLDLKLPVKSGFEVLAWIRRQPHLENLPVVIYSSSGAESDRQLAKSLGATDYLVKPSGLLQTKELFLGIQSRWFSE